MSTPLMFNGKPVTPIKGGHSFYFRTHEGRELWLTQRKVNKGYLFQWVPLEGGKPQRLHRQYKNRDRLDLVNENRDKILVKTLHNKLRIDKDEIRDFLEKLGLFYQENQNLLNLHLEKDVKGHIIKEEFKEEVPERPSQSFRAIYDMARPLIESENPLQEISDYISRSVKHDEILIKLSLIAMASTYTPEPFNLALEGPPSEGKTYALVRASKVFPRGDVWDLGGMTPQVLTRDRGVLMDKETGESLEPEISELQNQINKLGNGKADKGERNKLTDKLQAIYDRGEKVVNLEGKILLFFEAPQNKTLEILKPLMSHDNYEIEYKFVDRAYNNGPMVTLSAKIRGWPVFLYATADNRMGNLWDQIRSRFIVVSPEMSKEKYKAANEYTAQKHGNVIDLDKLREEREEFERCQAYILFIKKILYGTFEKVNQIIKENQIIDLPPEEIQFTLNPMAKKLEEEFPHSEGQYMREFDYFNRVMDSSSLFNLPRRPYIEGDQGLPYWIVTVEDLHNVEEVFNKYHFFIKGSELPLQIFRDVIIKMDLKWENSEGEEGFTKKDIRTALKGAGYDYSDTWITDNILEPLEGLNLLSKGRSKENKNRNIYTPFKEKYQKLSQNQFLRIKFGLNDLKEKFNQLKKVPKLRTSQFNFLIDHENSTLDFKNMFRGFLGVEGEDMDVFIENVYREHFNFDAFFYEDKGSESGIIEDKSLKNQNENYFRFSEGKGERREELEEEIAKLQNEAAKGNQGAYEDMEARVLELKQTKNEEAVHDTSLKSYEELMIERETLDYLRGGPDKPEFNEVARKISSKTSIDEPLVKKVIRGLIDGEAITFNDEGDLIPGEV